MSTSSVQFRGSSFVANDATLEVWLALVADEIDGMPDPPDWLADLRDDWDIQATSGFGFGVVPELDRWAADEARREVLVEVCERAYARLEQAGDPVPAGFLNGLRDWDGGRCFAQDVDADKLRRPARYFIKLLQGRLTADEADARFPPTVGQPGG